MTINFSNISLISDWVFDVSLNNIRINNIIDFDKYNINKKNIQKEKKVEFVLTLLNLFYQIFEKYNS